MRKAAAGGRHRYHVGAGWRAGVGRGAAATATTTPDEGCRQQGKDQQPESQLRSPSPSRDKQQEDTQKQSSHAGHWPTRITGRTNHCVGGGRGDRERGTATGR